MLGLLYVTDVGLFTCGRGGLLKARAPWRPPALPCHGTQLHTLHTSSRGGGPSTLPRFLAAFLQRMLPHPLYRLLLAPPAPSPLQPGPAEHSAGKAQRHGALASRECSGRHHGSCRTCPAARERKAPLLRRPCAPAPCAATAPLPAWHCPVPVPPPPYRWRPRGPEAPQPRPHHPTPHRLSAPKELSPSRSLPLAHAQPLTTTCTCTTHLPRLPTLRGYCESRAPVSACPCVGGTCVTC